MRKEYRKKWREDREKSYREECSYGICYQGNFRIPLLIFFPFSLFVFPFLQHPNVLIFYERDNGWEEDREKIRYQIRHIFFIYLRSGKWNKKSMRNINIYIRCLLQNIHTMCKRNIYIRCIYAESLSITFIFIYKMRSR